MGDWRRETGGTVCVQVNRKAVPRGVLDFKGLYVDYVEEDTERGRRITRAKIRDGTSAWTWWSGLATRLLGIANKDKGVQFGQADKLDDRPERYSVKITHLEFTQHSAEWNEIFEYCQAFLGVVDKKKARMS